MLTKIYKFTEEELRKYTQLVAENAIRNLDNIEFENTQNTETKSTQTFENDDDEKQMEILIIHMEKMTERKEHIEKTLEEIGLEPSHTYITDGNPESFTQEILDKYFGGKLILYPEAQNVTSCALKHFLAYEYIVQNNLEGALILEDDICLHDDFMKTFYKSIKEYHQDAHDKHNVIISYEDSPLIFVPRSKRKKNQVLYSADRNRCTGCYYINKSAAKAALDDATTKKCRIAIDEYHTYLQKQGILDYLWCQPAIATQGSYNGKFKSQISTKKDLMVKIRWFFKLNYKKLLYYFR